MLPPHFPDCYKKLKKWIKKRINIISTKKSASNENERIPNVSTTLNENSTPSKKLILNEETVISALNEDTLTQKTGTSNEIILSEKTDNEEERNTPTTKRTFNSPKTFSSSFILNSPKGCFFSKN
ncbi:unnamed protein product [Rhizophagus irregularis]|uniref:Uncharacterized protein n=1 Tax=Rhizophagus irregularis TaxID=588596 RepID=A0A2N1MU77_9GLOM|nr:hypothetical protein RhiirC2_853802 [Rhizophagus irregularis]CAB4375986.1 unnamed protein product [Rhizophagus irregularis]CAB5394429.1 unnamed protein product [Rhizophagus irregularis]